MSTLLAEGEPRAVRPATCSPYNDRTDDDDNDDGGNVDVDGEGNGEGDDDDDDDENVEDSDTGGIRVIDIR